MLMREGSAAADARPPFAGAVVARSIAVWSQWRTAQITSLCCFSAMRFDCKRGRLYSRSLAPSRSRAGAAACALTGRAAEAPGASLSAESRCRPHSR